jgi:hypothetical protein
MQQQLGIEQYETRKIRLEAADAWIARDSHNSMLQKVVVSQNSILQGLQEQLANLQQASKRNGF